MLSLFRLFTAPYFYSQLVSGSFFAFPVFILAVASDLLDGIIARRFDGSSVRGAVLDASADFFIIAAGFSYYVAVGLVSPILLIVMAASFLQYLATMKLTVSDLLGKYIGTVLYVLLAVMMLSHSVIIGIIVTFFGVVYILTSFFSRLQKIRVV